MCVSWSCCCPGALTGCRKIWRRWPRSTWPPDTPPQKPSPCCSNTSDLERLTHKTRTRYYRTDTHKWVVRVVCLSSQLSTVCPQSETSQSGRLTNNLQRDKQLAEDSSLEAGGIWGHTHINTERHTHTATNDLTVCGFVLSSADKTANTQTHSLLCLSEPMCIWHQ